MSQEKESKQAANVLRLLQPLLEALNTAPCHKGGCTFQEERRKPYGQRQPKTYCDPCAALDLANQLSACISSWRRGALLCGE